MTNPKAEYKDRDILSTEEIDLMIEAADTVIIQPISARTKKPNPFYVLRAKALIAIVKKFGKRRIEIGRLRRKDINTVGDSLEFTFTIAKKHKKGLFQYMKKIKETDPNILEKSLPEIKKLWLQWQQTEQGHSLKIETALQSIELTDKYTPFILDYLNFLEQNCPNAQFVFPTTRLVFGESLIISDSMHLSGSQLLRIIKPLNESAWLHLFRETKGAEIAKKYGRTIASVTEVKESLDLENESTAYVYVRRYAAKKQPKE